MRPDQGERANSSPGSEGSQPAPGAPAAAWLAWATAQINASEPRSPRLDAELLLATALELERPGLLARLREPIAAPVARRFTELVARRRAHEPVAYLRGRAAFWDFEVEVSPATLIPRAETETLVELALAHLPRAARRVADICTGTGCVLFALLRERAELRGAATEIKPAALELARRNAARLGLGDRIEWFEGDLLAPLLAAGAGPFDLMVSNPPYVDADRITQLEPAVRWHEPRAAYAAGEAGLAFHHRLLREASALLVAGGLLALEIGADQEAEVRASAQTAGRWEWLETRRDLASHPRAALWRRR